MNKLVDAIANKVDFSVTDNGALTLANSGKNLVDLFFVIGSGSASGSFGSDLYRKFEQVLGEDEQLALRTLLWSRDIRGGAGRRKNFRDILLKLEQFHPSIVKKLIPFISEYGRFDDLFIFQTKRIKDKAYAEVAKALDDETRAGLAAKWTPRKGNIAVEFRNYLGYSPKRYRKTLVGLTNVVESQMCAKEWGEIKYESVPSVASARYAKAFTKRDTDRYSKYIADVKNGDTKINASAVFPHDVMKNIYNAPETLEAQWDALPDYMNETKIIPMIDVSGSMDSRVSGTTSAMDIAVALGLYIADKSKGPFKDVTLTFSRTPSIDVLRGNIVSKYNQLKRQEWSMNTNIEAAFDAILQFAIANRVPQKDMPEMLIILSDMEFDNAVRGTTNYETAASKFEAAGYKVPKIIFWNLMGRLGNVPVRANDHNTALISGYAPAILKSVLSGEAFNPLDVVLKTIMSDRYDIWK